MHRSLSFAMQRVFFQTKRSFPATNGATEIRAQQLRYSRCWLPINNAKALPARASRNGNNAATRVGSAPHAGQPRGRQALWVID